MKKSKSKIGTILKRMVKEEVENQLKAMLADKPAEKNDESASLKETYLDEEVYQSSEPTRETIQYTKDPVLNEILNNTTGGISDGSGVSSYPVMGGQAFTSKSAPGGLGSQPVSRAPSDSPDFLKKALNKNYSDVIKKIKETHGSRHS